MTDTSKHTVPSPSIVIDTRLAKEDGGAGVGRYIIGFSRALAYELSRQPEDTHNKPRWKILLVSKHHPPTWVLELVKANPSIVSFWSGGPGALGSELEKPVYAWPSLTLKPLLKKLEGAEFFWVAPGNFDRPLTLFRSSKHKLYDRICQIIHDTIPFDLPESHGFLFRTQFRFFTKRALNKLKHVYTVSEHSAHRLSQVAPKRTLPVIKLSGGVDSIYGAKKKIIERDALVERRERFLKTLGGNSDEFVKKLAKFKWVVGVGRAQPYKRWDLAMQAVNIAKQHVSEPILFIRVGGKNESESAIPVNANGEFGAIEFKPDIPMLSCEFLSDQALAALYQLSDLLVHPSLAEGFGFPPAEAALCGLPVLYAKGTAVDDHFNGLPETFWRGVASTDPQMWAKALAEMLNAKPDGFTKQLAESLSARSFIMKYAQRSFNWQDTAQAFLHSIGS